MNEKTLSSDHLSEICGIPIYLSSKFMKNKLLTFDYYNKVIVSDHPQFSRSQQWIFIPFEENYLIVSPDGDMICHNIDNKNDVSIKRKITKFDNSNTEGCLWKISKQGEIYQENPDGGERYLWVANSQLLVTLDRFLAESWSLVFPNIEINKTLEVNDHQTEKIKTVLLIVILFTLLIIICTKHK